MSAATTLAVDVGGTKLAAGLVAVDGRIVVVRRAATPQVSDPEDVWEALAALVDAVLDARGDGGVAGPAAVGIGSAGPIDHTLGTVSPINALAWQGFPLVERLRTHLAERGIVLAEGQVHLAGDAVCGAVAELAVGAARGAGSGLFAVVSTGVGGGVFTGGAVLAGRRGNAGHLGHVVVDVHGDPCPCGGRGCVESIASGRSITRRALERGWAPPPGSPADAAAVANAARSGDPVAGSVIDDAGRALGAMIASAGAALEIEVAVLGGGVMRSADLLLPSVRRWLDELGRLSFLRDVEVRTATLVDDACLVGAGLLAHRPALLDLGDRHR
jgi:glucokinase